MATATTAGTEVPRDFVPRCSTYFGAPVLDKGYEAQVAEAFKDAVSSVKNTHIPGQRLERPIKLLDFSDVGNNWYSMILHPDGSIQTFYFRNITDRCATPDVPCMVTDGSFLVTDNAARVYAQNSAWVRRGRPEPNILSDILRNDMAFNIGQAVRQAEQQHDRR